MKHTEMIIVIGAHSEGRAVQVSAKSATLGWTDMRLETDFNFCAFDYRVKPAPKYKTITPASYLQESGHIDLSAEYVEIKALEDVIRLSDIHPCNMTDAQRDEWNAIMNLLN
jgi:hypothetical protein